MNFIGLCRYVLSSKIVELDSQSLLFVAVLSGHYTGALIQHF